MVPFQKEGNLDKDVDPEKIVLDYGDEELMNLQVRIYLSNTVDHQKLRGSRYEIISQQSCIKPVPKSLSFVQMSVLLDT